MKMITFGKLAVFAIVLSSLTQGIRLEANKRSNASLATELCAHSGNDLETGALRSVFEGIEHGLMRSGILDACVVVTDNGRSFSPECLIPGRRYQSETCKAEANTGVQATIFFAERTFFSQELMWIFLLYFAGLALLTTAISKFSRYITSAFTLEVRSVFLSKVEPENRPPLSKLADWFMRKSGILSEVTKSAGRLNSQLKDFESRIAIEAAHKAKQEQAAKCVQEYIEKVRQIQHDIRSPLSSLQAVRETVQSDELAERTLFSAIKRIQLLLDQLQEDDKIEEPSRLTIAEVVANEIAFEWQAKLKSSGIRLHFTYNQEHLSPVTVGPLGLRSVIDNLLQNAFDATQNVGDAIHLSVSSQGPNCVLTVEDNGSGIPPGAEAKLFRRGATFGKVNGIGLGLYHAKASVESWGGEISLEILTQGTRFVIKLPLTQTGVQFRNVDGKQPLKVIDDDATFIAGLKYQGHNVVSEALNFEKGRALLREHQPGAAIVLVDYCLGDARGTDLIAEFRSKPGLVLCTNDFDSPELIKCAKALGVAIVPKPLIMLSLGDSPAATPKSAMPEIGHKTAQTRPASAAL